MIMVEMERNNRGKGKVMLKGKKIRLAANGAKGKNNHMKKFAKPDKKIKAECYISTKPFHAREKGGSVKYKWRKIKNFRYKCTKRISMKSLSTEGLIIGTRESIYTKHSSSHKWEFIYKLINNEKLNTDYCKKNAQKKSLKTRHLNT